MTRIAGMIIAVVPAFVVAVVLVSLGFDNYYHRQAAAQVAAMVLFGVAVWAWYAGETIYEAARRAAGNALELSWRVSRRARVVAAALVGWAACVLAYVLMFEPFGRYISSYEWATIIKIITFPAIVAAIGYGLCSWARR